MSRGRRQAFEGKRVSIFEVEHLQGKFFIVGQIFLFFLHIS